MTLTCLPHPIFGSRGIRYDNAKMSRLMDVVGDGKDVVRMCIDATQFSNLGRFLNHSCDPNCFKQRIFCDHMANCSLTLASPYQQIKADVGILSFELESVQMQVWQLDYARVT